MVMAGFQTRYQAVPSQTPTRLATTVSAMIGASAPTAGSVTAFNVPFLARNLAEVGAKAGSDGDLYKYARAFFANVGRNANLILIQFDRALTGSARDNAVEGAINALLAAQQTSGVLLAPSLICLPGMTYNDTYSPADASVNTANPAIPHLEGICENLDALAVTDTAYHDTNATTDVTNATAWEGVAGNVGPRLLPVNPRFKYSFAPTVNEPFSPAVMGAMVANDDANGIADSIMGRPIRGLAAPAVALTHSYSAASQTQTLFSNGITTAVRDGGEWVGFGGRLHPSPATSILRFLPVRRIADEIDLRLRRIARPYLGRGITDATIQEIAAVGTAYLRGLVTLGHILDGAVTPDTLNNTTANLSNGHIYLNVIFVPLIPAELITLTIQISAS